MRLAPRFLIPHPSVPAAASPPLPLRGCPRPRRGRRNRYVDGMVLKNAPAPFQSPPRGAGRGRGRGEVGAEGLQPVVMNAPTSSDACGRHLPRPAGKAKTGEPFRLASLGTSPKVTAD